MLLVRRSDNFATFTCRVSRNFESLKLLEPKDLSQACNGIAFLRKEFAPLAEC